MPQKRVTMQQVANKAGVSRTTVSFVLNNTPNVSISAATRARIYHAAAELNYARDFAAHSLATGRSHTIGCVLRQKPDELLTNAFLGGLMGGVGQIIRPEGYRVLFEAVGHDVDAGSYTDLVRSQRVDGLLISGPVINDQELLNLFAEHVPIVIHGTPDNDALYSVDVDNVASAGLLVQHLIRLGHQRIAHITNGPLSYTASRDRLAGYRQAMAAAALPVRAEDVQINASFTDEGGYLAMKALLECEPLPTAVFAASDVVALGALRAITEHGLRIPQDISLAGFDDIPPARYLNPGLTTIRVPIAELGQASAGMLLQLIRGEKPPHRHVVLGTQLVVRQSTAHPPH
jgi:DNA-binding LacI/PurR family transcriptional regulator